LLFDHGRPVLFLWVFADQAGVPVPVVPLLLGVGALAGEQQLGLPVAVALAVAASLLADLLWYAVGRRRGVRALGILCGITLEPDSCVRRAQELFLQHRLRSQLIGKFLPGLNPLVAGLAGAVGVGLGRFVVYDLGSAAVWAGAWTGLGYLLREAITGVLEQAAHLGKDAIALVASAFVAYAGVKYVQRRRFLRRLRIARIRPEELRRKLDSGEPLMVVDLRTALEQAADPYTVPGALRMTPDELERRHAEIARDADVVLLCA